MNDSSVELFNYAVRFAAAYWCSLCALENSFCYIKSARLTVLNIEFYEFCYEFLSKTAEAKNS